MRTYRLVILYLRFYLWHLVLSYLVKNVGQLEWVHCLGPSWNKLYFLNYIRDIKMAEIRKCFQFYWSKDDNINSLNRFLCEILEITNKSYYLYDFISVFERNIKQKSSTLQNKVQKKILHAVVVFVPNGRSGSMKLHQGPWNWSSLRD